MVRGGTAPSSFELQRDLKGKVGPNGRPLCTWCRNEVPKGRRSWCSQSCVDQYRIHHDWGFVRRNVLKRDKGICAHCGRDMVRLNERYWKTRRWMLRRIGHGDLESSRRTSEYLLKDWIDAYRAKHGIPLGRLWSDWWDADHIKPVCEGGTNELENLRTLCIRCHQAETKALAGRRSKKNVSAKMIEDGE